MVTEMQAPYAPLKAVMSIIDRHRQVRLPVIDASVLDRTGVTESLVPRTLRALEQLGLIDENGVPTNSFERLRVAPSDEYHAELEKVVRDAYAPVFEVVDPTTASVTQIEDAFRGFNPAGQRPRMVTLFTGLMSEAGMISDVPKKATGRPSTNTSRTNTAARAPARKPHQQGTEVREQPPQHGGSTGSGDTYSVDLKSGGKVTVTVDVNLFSMSASDREFVIHLVDSLKGYAGANTTSEPEAS